MSELPDLDTSNKSFMAFWNVLDQGGLVDFDVSEVTSYNKINDYTVYDNGIQGTGGARGCDGWRVKSDGWFIAWVGDTVKYDTGTIELDTEGPWQIDLNMGNKVDGDGRITPDNGLERTIYGLQNELSDSPTYNSSDVGLYDYLHPNATNITVMSGGSNDAGNLAFEYTDSTTLHEAWLVGNVDYDGDSAYAEFPGGTTVATTSGYGGGWQNDWGVYSLTDNNKIPNSGTGYSGNLQSGWLTAHVMWS
jgi:hypothetical protein